MNDAAPGGFAHRALLAGTGGDRALHGGIKVFDRQVAVQWRPVAGVAALRLAGGGAARRFVQQVDRDVGAEQLDRIAAEAARWTQCECGGVESFPGRESGDTKTGK